MALQLAYKSNISVSNISKTVSSLRKGIDNSQKSANRINTTLVSKSIFTRKSLANDRNMFAKRREAVRRREQEDIVEASGIGGAIKRQGKVISSSTKGFLGRILDFIGTLMVGWLLNSLPTIISLAEQLINRIKRTVTVLAGFINGVTEIFSGFSSLLSKSFSNLLSFDFDTQRDVVESSMKQIQRGFVSIENSIQQVINIFSEPFDFGEQEQETAGETPSGTPGAGGQLQPIHKQALDVISGPESGGDYNAMNNGKAGDRPGGSKKWLGKNLTDMTIGEVMDFQNNKKTLWAAGRYQFVPNTLPGAMKSAGLSPKDMFDKNNQDLMAVKLIQQRGIQPWTAGGSKYSAKEVQIVEKARNTPLGPAAPKPPQGSRPQGGITTTVKDEVNVAGPTGGTSSVGISDVFGYSAWRGRVHAGIDIGTSGQKGWYVSLRKSGQVVFAGASGGYGNMVDIVGPDGTCYRFAHLARILVKIGPYNGETIGEIGKTGRTTGGIHLHFEVRPNGPQGDAVDPRPWLGLLAIGRQVSGVSGQPASVSSPTGTPAQISPISGSDVSEQITTERSGAVIMMPPLFPEQPLPQQKQLPGGNDVAYIPETDPTISLNRLILNRLLLDLAYT